MNIENIYDRFRSNEHMEFNEAATDIDISSFEQENAIKLPNSYIKLLKFFDGGELFIPGTMLYGINHCVGNHMLSEINKSRNLFKITDTMLIIGQTNYGDLFCIDLDNQNIIQWDHEKDVELCRWNSLEEWLEETIKNSV